MSLYRLDPVDRNHPSWAASSVKECLWASAATPEDARKLVAGKTAALVQPAYQFAPKVSSPWLDERITSCVWEPDGRELPEGSVVNANWREIGP